jgi:hypothetical protein
VNEQKTDQWLTYKLGAILAKHVEPIFKRGTQFTLIARTPGEPDCDVLVTSDDLDEVIALVQRSKDRDEVHAAAQIGAAATGGRE